jgi:hypothetical protein
MIFGLHRGLDICIPARTMTTGQEDSVRNENDTGFPKLSAPARRALARAGYAHLDQLAEVSESELERLHGMGPTALAALRAALAERGRSFRDQPHDSGGPRSRASRLTQ